MNRIQFLLESLQDLDSRQGSDAAAAVWGRGATFLCCSNSCGVGKCLGVLRPQQVGGWAFLVGAGPAPVGGCIELLAQGGL